MILHLIRHPRPLVEPGICYGRLDVAGEHPELVAARLLAELPAGLPVYSSPLRRCRELAGHLQAQPVIDARLAEMNFGDWEGRAWDDISRAELDAWAADVAGYAPPGGESPVAVQQRALDFVAGLRVPEAVVVTHAGVIRVLMAHWQGLPARQWTTLQFGFGSLTSVRVPEDGAQQAG
ncbi:MAG: alpha-ribazole phosphatase family protein [Azonexus sp.]